MNDAQAAAVVDAVLNLAVTIRDEVGPGVAAAVQKVTAAAGGDTAAALVIAAALIRVDQPVDAWWQELRPVAEVDIARLMRLSEQYAEDDANRLAPCGTASAHSRHIRRGEPIDAACRAARRLADQERRERETPERRAARHARSAERTRGYRAAKKSRDGAESKEAAA